MIPRAMVLVLAEDKESTFEAWYSAHRRRVFGWALRYGGGESAWAQDLAHDVFVRLWEHLDEFAPDADVGGWLYRVTANLAVSRLRREQSFLGRILPRYGAGREEVAASAEARIEEREEVAIARRILQTLPAPERVVLCMKHLDGKSQREIAQALHMSEGNVSKLAARAWARLEERPCEV
jgi:RNA polymerase sigma-70 factor (ECF subfamily)